MFPLDREIVTNLPDTAAVYERFVPTEILVFIAVGEMAIS